MRNSARYYTPKRRGGEAPTGMPIKVPVIIIFGTTLGRIRTESEQMMNRISPTISPHEFQGWYVPTPLLNVIKQVLNAIKRHMAGVSLRIHGTSLPFPLPLINYPLRPYLLPYLIRHSPNIPQIPVDMPQPSP